MEKIARNDPCPCGSQKKFKHCCAIQTASIPSIDLDIEWQEVRRIEGELFERASIFASEKWGPEFIADAYDAFFLDSELEDDSFDRQEFFPSWFVFRWVPFDYSKKWEHLGSGATVADLYVRENNLQKYRPFLDDVSRSPYSFFLVEDVIPSRRIVLKDLLLERTVTIKEQRGADLKAKGTVVFFHLVSHKGQDIQIGFAPTALPLRYTLDVLDLKKEILKKEKTLTPDVLFKYDNDLRKAYFAWAKSAYRLPKICNTDGDPIVICTLDYEFSCSAQAAFDRLVPLCKRKSRSEVLEGGVFDKEGHLCAINFPWLRGRSENIVLGEIKIEKNKLNIHVNSLQRSQKIQKEIEKRLPEAHLIKENQDPLDLSTIKQRKTSPRKPITGESQMLQAYLKDYYRSWLDLPLPVLSGETPRQAAKTTEGRERLNFILMEFEKSNEQKDNSQRIDVDNLRQELGLLP